MELLVEFESTGFGVGTRTLTKAIGGPVRVRNCGLGVSMEEGVGVKAEAAKTVDSEG